eukprot:g5461.t1
MDISLTPSQTLKSLKVAADDLPSKQFEMLPQGGSYNLGDVVLRARPQGAASSTTTTTTATPYTTLTSSRGPPVVPIDPLPTGELAAATVPLAGGDPALSKSLLLERHYYKPAGSADDGQGLTIRFDLRNNGTAHLEIGAFGLPMIFATSNACNRSTLDSLAATCAMVDPAISSHHGFVSVTRMTGTGAVLLVVPKSKTGFEAYRNMPEAGFGGAFYELTSLSAAYAAEEWVNASTRQWIEPTSQILAPGQQTSFTFRLLLAPGGVRDKDAALQRAGFAVLQAVPSYAIATDMANASLHVLPPRGASIVGTTVEPMPSLFTLGPASPIGKQGFFALPIAFSAEGGNGDSKLTKGGTKGGPSHRYGRARVTVHYSDGTDSVASYFVLPPLDQHVLSYGRFMSEVAWYDNVTDPFGRGHSVLAWNRALKKHIGVGPWDNGYEDNRIFNNGLSDEAGAGANVGLAAVAGGTVDPAVAAKLDLYINDTVYGIKPGLPFGASLQCIDGDEASESPSCGPPSVVGPTAGGVMASMFWVPTSSAEPRMPGYDYDPLWFCDQNKTKGASCPPGWPGWRWDQARGASLGRAYNYAHVSSTYLGMYQAAEYDALKTLRPRKWYLTRAYKTIVAMYYQASWYSHQGLMDGTNFWTVLEALKAEGDMQQEAAEVEAIMRKRAVDGVENQCRFYVINNTIHDLTPPPNVTKPGCHWYAVENTTAPWKDQTGLPGAGSEFAWDTTGQEEAYIWGRYFGETALASSALNQILAYTPLVPNWAWHGSAYGVGDFGNNGYVRFNGGTERVLQHYRSGLNAIPSTEAFLSDPSDMYLLRLAAGSISGVLTNIEVPSSGAGGGGG